MLMVYESRRVQIQISQEKEHPVQGSQGGAPVAISLWSQDAFIPSTNV